ncbi:hypothetical protein ABDF71_25210 [Ochrobactrum sp. WV_118_8]|uniref:hypothetical protein n=1 Tax=Ochrobactrum sp. CGA5 TaxID=2583453 RepID=UPI001121AA19|nr:hypothetical protein [Ochrobactrum sp. CGA5]
MQPTLTIELDEKIAREAANGILHHLSYTRNQLYNGVRVRLKRATKTFDINILHFDTTAITMVMRSYDALEDMLRDYCHVDSQADKKDILDDIEERLICTPTFGTYAEFRAWFMKRADYKDIHQSLVKDKRLTTEFKIMYSNAVIIITWMLLPRWARSEAGYNKKWTYLTDIAPFGQN